MADEPIPKDSNVPQPFFENLEHAVGKSGGTVHKVKGSRGNTMIIVEMPGNPPQRHLFARVNYQGYQAHTDSAYTGLPAKEARGALARDGFDADHAVSRRQAPSKEGYVLMQGLEASVNRSHGSVEKAKWLSRDFNYRAEGTQQFEMNDQEQRKQAGLLVHQEMRTAKDGNMDAAQPGRNYPVVVDFSSPEHQRNLEAMKGAQIERALTQKEKFAATRDTAESKAVNPTPKKSR